MINHAQNAPVKRSDTYHAPSASDWHQALEAWENLAVNSLELTATRLGSLGFDVRSYGNEIRFSPANDTARGWGIYSWRSGSQQPVLIQVPHPYYDRHTQTIGQAGWEYGARGLAISTAHRRLSDPGKDKRHLMGAFQQAIVSSHPDTWVVQIHGFASHKRKTAVGRISEIIVSNGSSNPGPQHHQLIDCLKDYGWSTGLFPDEVDELGGTTNVLGASLRDMGSNRFIHVELSSGVRQELIEHAPAMHAFWQCIQGVTSEDAE